MLRIADTLLESRHYTTHVKVSWEHHIQIIVVLKVKKDVSMWYDMINALIVLETCCDHSQIDCNERDDSKVSV